MSAHEVPAENFVTSLRRPKSMDEAHREDYSDKRRIDDQARALEVFLTEGPPRLHKFTRQALEHAIEQLREDSARTVRRWD